jgi:hypothetical protein
MLTPYDGTADFLPNHEMAISHIFRSYSTSSWMQLFFNFVDLLRKITECTELLPDGALKYAEKAFYDVPVAPVGKTLLSG